jgi:hypothetical protein
MVLFIRLETRELLLISCSGHQETIEVLVFGLVIGLVIGRVVGFGRLVLGLVIGRVVGLVGTCTCVGIGETNFDTETVA